MFLLLRMVSKKYSRFLWNFLQQLLNDSNQRYTHLIAWKDKTAGIFKIVDPPGLARLWGIQKNHPTMDYDKLSRALRYYYKMNSMRKVKWERHAYQFLRNPTEAKRKERIFRTSSPVGCKLSTPAISNMKPEAGEMEIEQCQIVYEEDEEQ